MDGIASYSARSKYHSTFKKPRMYAFYSPPDFGGLAARLYSLLFLCLFVEFERKFQEKQNDTIITRSCDIWLLL